MPLFKHLFAGFHVREEIWGNLGKLDFRENFEVLIPDGVSDRFHASQINIVRSAANHQADEVGLLAVSAAGVQEDSNDFRTFAKINLADFALVPVHRSRVDLIALGDQLGDFLGEKPIDVVLVHKSVSFRFGSNWLPVTLPDLGTFRLAAGQLSSDGLDVEARGPLGPGIGAISSLKA